MTPEDLVFMTKKNLLDHGLEPSDQAVALILAATVLRATREISFGFARTKPQRPLVIPPKQRPEPL